MKYNFQHESEKKRACAYLRKLIETPTIHLVEIVAKRKRRTNDQNEWLWGCIYPMLLQALIREGWEFVEVEEVHEYFKHEFTSQKVINKHTCEVIEFPKSTAKMDTLAFSEYCEMLRSYALDFLNIEIPDPDPEWKNEKINK